MAPSQRARRTTPGLVWGDRNCSDDGRGACEDGRGMRVVCAWCEREGRPMGLDERRPFDDRGTTHTICGRHHTEILAQLPSKASPGVEILLVVPAAEAELEEQLTKLCAGRTWVSVIVERRASDHRRVQDAEPSAERRQRTGKKTGAGPRRCPVRQRAAVSSSRQGPVLPRGRDSLMTSKPRPVPASLLEVSG